MIKCDLCGITDQAFLYERTPSAWRCRARTGCETRQKRYPDMAPAVDDFPVHGQPTMAYALRARAAGAPVSQAG
jgi:hypothetical protein